MNLLDIRILTIRRTAQSVAECLMRKVLTLHQSCGAVLHETIHAHDMADSARKHNDRLLHSSARQTRNLQKVELHQVERNGCVALATSSVLGTLEIELGERQAAPVVVDARNLIALTMPSDLPWLQHVRPVLWVAMHREGAPLALAATHAQLACAHFPAFWTVDKESGAFSISFTGRYVLTFFSVQLQRYQSLAERPCGVIWTLSHFV